MTAKAMAALLSEEREKLRRAASKKMRERWIAGPKTERPTKMNEIEKPARKPASVVRSSWRSTKAI
jgi:hypothetical protein